MWRYNRLIKKGYKPITVDSHEINGISWTNVLLGNGLKRKTVRLDGRWTLDVLKGKDDE